MRKLQELLVPNDRKVSRFHDVYWTITTTKRSLARTWRIRILPYRLDKIDDKMFYRRIRRLHAVTSAYAETRCVPTSFVTLANAQLQNKLKRYEIDISPFRSYALATFTGVNAAKQQVRGCDHCYANRFMKNTKCDTVAKVNAPVHFCVALKPRKPLQPNNANG